MQDRKMTEIKSAAVSVIRRHIRCMTWRDDAETRNKHLEAWCFVYDTVHTYDVLYHYDNSHKRRHDALVLHNKCVWWHLVTASRWCHAGIHGFAVPVQLRWQPCTRVAQSVAHASTWWCVCTVRPSFELSILHWLRTLTTLTISLIGYALLCCLFFHWCLATLWTCAGFCVWKYRNKMIRILYDIISTYKVY